MHRVTRKKAKQLFLKGVRIYIKLSSQLDNDPVDSWKIGEIEREEKRWQERWWDDLTHSFKEYRCDTDEFPTFWVE